MQARAAGITEEIVKAMTSCSTKLSKGRKQRVPPAELASADELASYQLLGSQPLHKTGKASLHLLTRFPCSGVGATKGSRPACSCCRRARGPRVHPTRKGCGPEAAADVADAFPMQGGIKAIDTSPTSSAVVATAGGDSVVAVYDSSAGRLLAELRGHTKKVNGKF